MARKNPNEGHDVMSNPANVKTQNDELIAMAASFTECVMSTHNISADFAGLSLNILRDPDTHRLEAIVITPVDMLSDKPVERFDPVRRVREVPKPKLVLAS